MPSFAPRSLEPYKKRAQLEQRIVELRAALGRDSTAAVLKAAENLRTAKLGVIKAKRHLIASTPAALTGLEKHPYREALLRQLANLDRERNWWSSAPVEHIIDKYAG